MQASVVVVQSITCPSFGHDTERGVFRKKDSTSKSPLFISFFLSLHSLHLSVLLQIDVGRLFNIHFIYVRVTPSWIELH